MTPVARLVSYPSLLQSPSFCCSPGLTLCGNLWVKSARPNSSSDGSLRTPAYAHRGSSYQSGRCTFPVISQLALYVVVYQALLSRVTHTSVQRLVITTPYKPASSIFHPAAYTPSV